MSSAYGIFKEQQAYIAPYNPEQLMQIATLKEQQYETNVQKVDEYINNIVNVDLLKDQDKQYLYNRLNKVAADINSVGGIDFSNSAITRNVLGHLKRAVDGNVMQAIDSTARVRTLLTEIQKKKEANDGTYNLVNEAHAMQGVNAYLASDSVTTETTRYVGTPYQNYIDVYGTKAKQFEEMLKERGDQTYDIPQPDGSIITKKGKNLNPDEVRSIFYSTLTPAEKNQLSINAWYNYGRTGEQGISEAFNKYSAGKLQIADADIGRIETNLGSLKGEQLLKAQNDLKFLKEQRGAFKRMAEETKDPNQMAMLLETEGMVGSLVDRYTNNPYSYTISKNDAYFAAQNLRLDQSKLGLEERKFAADVQYKAEDLAIKRLNAETAALNASGKSGTDSSDPSSLVGYSAGTPTPTEKTTIDKRDEINQYLISEGKATEATAKEISNRFRTDPGLSSYMTASGKSVDELLQAEIVKVKNDVKAKDQTISDEKARAMALDSLLTDENSDYYKNASPETQELFRNYKVKRREHQSQLDHYTESIQKVQLNTEPDWKYISNRLTSGLNFLGMEASQNIYLESQGMSLNDFLSRNNLWDDAAFENYIKKNPEIKDEILSSIYSAGLGVGVTKLKRPGAQITTNEYGGTLIPTDRLYSSSELDALLSPALSKLSKVTGSSNKATDYIDTFTDSSGNSYIHIKRDSPLNEGMRSTIQGIALGIEKERIPLPSMGVSGTGAFIAKKLLPDSSRGNFIQAVDDLVYGTSAVSPDETQVIDNIYGNLLQYKTYAFTPLNNKAVHDKLKAQLTIGKEPVDETGGITMTFDPNDPNQVILRQPNLRFNKSGGAEGGVSEVKVRKQDLQGALGGLLDLSAPDTGGDMFTKAPLSPSNVGSYLNPIENLDAINYYKKNGMSIDKINMATTGGALQFISNNDPDGWLTKDWSALKSTNESDYNAIMYIQAGINNILDSPQVIKVGTHSSGGQNYIDVVVGTKNYHIPTEAQGLTKDLTMNGNIGLTAFLANLVRRSQAGGQDSASAYQTLLGLIEEHNKVITEQ